MLLVFCIDFFSFFGLSPNDVTNIMGVVQFNFERVSGWSSNVTHSLKWVGIIFEFVFLFSSTCIFSDYFFNIHSIVINENFMFNVNTKIYKKEVIALEIIVPKCVCIREWHKLLFRLFTRVIKLLVQIDSICSILQIQFQIPIVLQMFFEMNLVMLSKWKIIFLLIIIIQKRN